MVFIYISVTSCTCHFALPSIDLKLRLVGVVGASIYMRSAHSHR